MKMLGTRDRLANLNPIKRCFVHDMKPFPCKQSVDGISEEVSQQVYFIVRLVHEAVYMNVVHRVEVPARENVFPWTGLLR